MSQSVLKLESFLIKALKLSETQACRYFKETFGLTFEPGQMTHVNDISFLSHFTGVVTLRNEKNLALLLFTFDRTTLGQLLSQIYHRDPGAISDDSMKQGVGEMTSVIYASVRKVLNESGYSFDRGQAAVLTDQEITPFRVPFREIAVTPLHQGFLVFKISVLIPKSEDPSLEAVLYDLGQLSLDDHRNRIKKVSSSGQRERR